MMHGMAGVILVIASWANQPPAWPVIARAISPSAESAAHLNPGSSSELSRVVAALEHSPAAPALNDGEEDVVEKFLGAGWLQFASLFPPGARVVRLTLSFRPPAGEHAPARNAPLAI
jgi:hypothetical protein